MALPNPGNAIKAVGAGASTTSGTGLESGAVRCAAAIHAVNAARSNGGRGSVEKYAAGMVSVRVGTGCTVGATTSVPMVMLATPAVRTVRAETLMATPLENVARPG
ncbi:hypothetical protein MAGR_67470 [Mycolicibacterium agri]|uniref:Uncharacterized protein n=1 Tax=Mycolicibacterium agri TaxID=36811 RepID=A0A7I9WDH2_MYCAG|nr:hypothetical protein MAGR_67470 [Mycolicibacterium agri]